MVCHIFWSCLAEQNTDWKICGSHGSGCEHRFQNYLVSGQCHHRPLFSPLTPESNPSAQRCLTRFFTGDFASWTVHFVHTKCVKNQQMQQLFIQFIMYGSSYIFRHYIAIFRERSKCILRDAREAVDRILWMGVLCLVTWCCSIEEKSIEYCWLACCV
jgi:hypothetical protein